MPCCLFILSFQNSTLLFPGMLLTLNLAIMSPRSIWISHCLSWSMCIKQHTDQGSALHLLLLCVFFKPFLEAAPSHLPARCQHCYFCHMAVNRNKWPRNMSAGWLPPNTNHSQTCEHLWTSFLVCWGFVILSFRPQKDQP